MPHTRRAVFLDRDGTLIEEGEYLHRPEDVRIFSGTGAALRQLSEAGFALFIVSNQSGVGRGYFTMADVENVHRHLYAELAREGVKFTKYLSHRRRRTNRAGAASRRRNFSSTRGMSLGWTWAAAT